MGELRIWRVASEKDMREFSNGISFGETGIALASSRVSKDLKHCDVYIVNDNMLKRYNASYSGELRHELGHCNGWTQKHEGGKTVQVSKEVEVKLPPGTQTLRAYPPLVCLTPDGKEEPCNDRGKKSPDQMIGFTTRNPWNYK